MGQDRTIPEAFWSSPEVRELVHLGGDLYGLDNDIAGYLRDAQSPRQIRWNLVDVIVHAQGVSAEAAMERACELHRRRMRRVADLCRAMRESGDIVAREFAIDFEYLMSGPWPWYHRAERHRVVEEF